MCLRWHVCVLLVGGYCGSFLIATVLNKWQKFTICVLEYGFGKLQYEQIHTNAKLAVITIQTCTCLYTHSYVCVQQYTYTYVMYVVLLNSNNINNCMSLPILVFIYFWHMHIKVLIECNNWTIYYHYWLCLFLQSTQYISDLSVYLYPIPRVNCFPTFFPLYFKVHVVISTIFLRFSTCLFLLSLVLFFLNILQTLYTLVEECIYA